RRAAHPQGAPALPGGEGDAQPRLRLRLVAALHVQPEARVARGRGQIGAGGADGDPVARWSRVSGTAGTLAGLSAVHPSPTTRRTRCLSNAVSVSPGCSPP